VLDHGALDCLLGAAASDHGAVTGRWSLAIRASSASGRSELSSSTTTALPRADVRVRAPERLDGLGNALAVLCLAHLLEGHRLPT
jgi:hypothetical protein